MRRRALLLCGALTVALSAAASLLGGAALPRVPPAGADGCTVPPFTYRHGTVALTERGRTVDVRVEVADTEQMREYGLMCRRSLEPDAGMLFVFDDLTRAPFWMKHTYIPLSIAFFDARWRIVGIMDMRVAPDPENPPAEDVWAPNRPYRYALEVNQGFFKEHTLDDRAQVRFTAGGPVKP